MEKKQSELCLEILGRFHKAGILDNLILIGSWCVYFYKDYFSDVPYVDQTTIKTRDIDFLIDFPAKIKLQLAQKKPDSQISEINKTSKYYFLVFVPQNFSS